MKSVKEESAQHSECDTTALKQDLNSSQLDETNFNLNLKSDDNCQGQVKTSLRKTQQPVSNTSSSHLTRTLKPNLTLVTAAE